MKTITIEMKVIIGIVFFTLFIVSLQRYEFSNNIIDQFIESKKSKNMLLVNTVSPVISLNLSLGLSDANREYLDQIIRENKDINFLEVLDEHNNTIYRYKKKNIEKNDSEVDEITKSNGSIVDAITGFEIAKLSIGFDQKGYDVVVLENRNTTIETFLLTFILILLFVIFLRREFSHLRKLSQSVLAYDPKLNNFICKSVERTDEVGVIQNAIITMVTRINTYTKLLDDLNRSLEDKVKERTAELEDANHKLMKLSTLDPLTQIANRRHFENYMQDIWSLAVRTRCDISIIMCDIDFFKSVNDTYGHPVGDEVLKNVASTIHHSLKRSSDLVARYGGEEFIIILYDTHEEGAFELCEDIAKNLSDVKNFQVGDLKIKPFTLSFGVCSAIPSSQMHFEKLVEAADNALYKAKENGRNRFESCGKKGLWNV